MRWKGNRVMIVARKLQMPTTRRFVLGVMMAIPALGLCGCNPRRAMDGVNHSTLASNKALVRDYYENIVSSGDLTSIADYVAEDYVYVHDGERHHIGIDGEQAHIRGVRQTYPDLRLTVERQIAEGEWVVSVITACGTHRGDWMGMRPTNEYLTISAVNVDRVVNGRILEHSGAANLLAPLLQAGAIRIADPVRDAGWGRER